MVFVLNQPSTPLVRYSLITIVISRDQIMETETLYVDSLVKIENNAITFFNYSPFSGKEKTIPMD
jgi:hypothetical protein